MYFQYFMHQHYWLFSIHVLNDNSTHKCVCQARANLTLHIYTKIVFSLVSIRVKWGHDRLLINRHFNLSTHLMKWNRQGIESQHDHKFIFSEATETTYLIDKLIWYSTENVSHRQLSRSNCEIFASQSLRHTYEKGTDKK